MRGFADRAGAPVPPVRVETRSLRSLKAIAVENVVEGCVRETLGAAVAQVQAARANSRRMRVAMARIAHDETQHARLAWELASWLDGKLQAAARRRVRNAATKAIEALACSLRAPIDPVVGSELGLPTAVQATALFASLRSSLWDGWGGRTNA